MSVKIKTVPYYDRDTSTVKPVKERPSPDGKGPNGVVWHSKDSCERKGAAFATERDAWFRLRKLNREGGNFAGRVPYQCRWCGFWHIGKRPGGGNG